MQKARKRLWTIAAILFLGLNSLAAGEIVTSWEFNEGGNAEGWELRVADGMLRATERRLSCKTLCRVH